MYLITNYDAVSQGPPLKQTALQGNNRVHKAYTAEWQTLFFDEHLSAIFSAKPFRLKLRSGSGVIERVDTIRINVSIMTKIKT